MATMAFFDTIKEFPHSGNLKFIRTADKIDNMEFNRDTPVVKGEQFLPSIYMFSLGKVKELRERMSISSEHNDDSVVAKYGYTKDFSKITEALRQKYAYMDKVNLQLLHHEYIDQKYIFKAESDIEMFVTIFKMKLDYEKEDEMIVIPQRLERQVKQEYALMGNKYVGHNSMLITKIKFLESELKRETLAFVSQLALKNAELKQKDSEIDIIKRDSTIEQNLLKAEINQKNAEIEIIKRDSTIENNQLKAEIDKRDSTIENNLLKAENDNIKRDSIIEKQRTDMKMMVMEQQLLEHKRIIEKTN